MRFLWSLVEMTGVEPMSESIFTPASTSVDCDLRFPSRIARNQAIRCGSFCYLTVPETKGGSCSPLGIRLNVCRGTQDERRLPILGCVC